MIVKNESPVIERALASVKPYIDAWAIDDTGSGDDTCELVQSQLAGVHGKLERVPWVDFGYNRTQALRRARAMADYVLMIDADMTVHVYDPAFKGTLQADGYLIRYEGDLDYRQPMLLKSALDWWFEGVTHEYVRTDNTPPLLPFDGLTLRHHLDGSNRRNKFVRDVALLERALATDPGNLRNRFYLANSYRDLGRNREAIRAYDERARGGGWFEEAWYARYQAALLRGRAGEPWPNVLAEMLAVYADDPARLEPLFEIARTLRERQQYAAAFLFARAVVDTPYPHGRLFVERDVYAYKLPLEYAICAHYVGRYDEALRVYAELDQIPDLPDEIRQLIASNRVFSEGM